MCVCVGGGVKLAKGKTISKETEKRHSVLVTVRSRLENFFVLNVLGCQDLKILLSFFHVSR